MAEPGSLPLIDARVGDREREAVRRELARQFAEGRIEAHEFEERMGEVLRASTAGHLAVALRGLPGSAVRVLTAPARERSVAVVRGVDRAAMRTHTAVFTGVNGGAVALWAAAGAGTPWPVALLLPTGALLAGHVAVRRRVRRMAARRR
ncbi:DUF1707 SHOCT-like domain-containing protein [Patulibacter americanus]|uniref:DUF1707 SHOCT-like domain-containing protein n=1 Tax=Patulibacter americanus TaxID=588672 RepID=UPI0003B553A5|nr:DUF1707 domain-containing protein [Patulibacter americanus]